MTTAVLAYPALGRQFFNDQSLGIGNQVPSSQEPGLELDARVRLGLRLSFFKSPKHRQKRSEPKVEKIVMHTLRAKTQTPNHFYIDEIHILTEPTQWNKKTNAYQLRLSFFEEFGPNRKVEEKLGDLIVSGRLHGEENIYVLHGFGKTLFKDKFGNPKLQVVAGYKPAKNRRKGKIARAGKR